MSPSSTPPTPTPVYPGQASSSWTVPTPPPVPVPSIPTPSSYLSKRKRRRKNSEPLAPRETIVDPDAIQSAKKQCQDYSGNYVLSCFPKSSDRFPQHEVATFIWNSRLPQYAQKNRVDIYLFQAWTRQPIMRWENVAVDNQQAGEVVYPVNDTWWGDKGTEWDGEDVSYPMFWAITPAGEGIDDNAYTPQATFQAVQTTYADFVVASMSSASVSSASAASVASASAAAASLSLFSETQTLTSDGKTNTVIVVGGASSTHSSIFTTITPVATPGGKDPGSVQSGSGSSHFPHWAIAVIVVLGVLAIVTGGILAWLIMRRLRHRRAASSNRTSVNSGTPMLDPNAGQHAPLMAEAGLAGAGLDAAAALPKEETQPKSIAGDAASTISRAHSESAPFSGADAAIMADAFRKALRKPEFPGGLEEGDTPESAKDRREAELLGAELATEGRDLRSVGSSHNVRVQGSSERGHDDQSTIEEHV